MAISCRCRIARDKRNKKALMDARTKLMDLCDSVLIDPDLIPRDGKTYCNTAAYKICFNYGYDLYDPNRKDLMMANEIEAWVRSNWAKITGLKANRLANEGKIAMAAQKGTPHGHIAIIYPGAMVYSGKWAKEVPVVANVGARNGVMGCNYAFKTEPAYYTDPKNNEVA